MGEDYVTRAEYEARARDVDTNIGVLRESVETLRDAVDKERESIAMTKGRLEVYKILVPVLTFALGSSMTAVIAVTFHV